jgi:endonuclease/exonuclease/phosphatase family metal-dependent hydrolase
VVRVIEGMRADVVCLQEAPRLLFGPTLCRRLADDLGMAMIAGGRSAAANLLLGDPSITVQGTRALLFIDTGGGSGAEWPWPTYQLRFSAGHRVPSGVETERFGHATNYTRPSTSLSAQRATMLAGDVNDEPGSAT